VKNLTTIHKQNDPGCPELWELNDATFSPYFPGCRRRQQVSRRWAVVRVLIRTPLVDKSFLRNSLKVNFHLVAHGIEKPKALVSIIFDSTSFLSGVSMSQGNEWSNRLDIKHVIAETRHTLPDTRTVIDIFVILFAEFFQFIVVQDGNISHKF